MIPSRKRCLDLLKKYNVPQNIIKHSLVVSRIAVFLATELNKKGHNLNLEEIEAAALLHDIKKMDSLKTKTSHAHEAGRLMKELGYNEIAKIVEQHVFLDENNDSSKILEEELVNYSDKRVRHSKVVTLEERFKDLRKRYGKDKESIEVINNLERKAIQVENKIFSNLTFKPQELGKIIKRRKKH
ncbi:MAG: HDIG domain-containing metalloprotein [Candidatus Freyarchaeota archaeon]